MGKKEVQISPTLIGFVVLLALAGPVLLRCVKTVDPGYVCVATFFGEVQKESYGPGLHFPVNPFLSFTEFDVRNKEHKERIGVPSQDQLTTEIDVSVKYHIDGGMVGRILEETGLAEQVLSVHITPAVRSIVREQGKSIARAEDFFREETQEQLQTGVLGQLIDSLSDKGVVVEQVLIRDIDLPKNLIQQIERKKEAEQEVERQKAELEKFRTQQEQKVAEAEAKLDAAEKEAQTIRLLAEAKAYEIQTLTEALANAKGYIQLQALDALQAISQDPAAKLYFMNGDAPMPLPLMNMGLDNK